MRVINEIIVHCSATQEGKDYRAAHIDRWHKQRGWRGIGYHYVVDLDGTVEKGRVVSQAGSHCYGRNAHSIGICYIGGLDSSGKPRDTRTPPQKAALLKLITNLTKIYHCKVSGHRDYAKKECPCFNARDEYGNILQQVILRLSK